ncbi:MAG: hypothetical protein EP348_03440 [Alphaproteobacteria bacterium]|nr:MAG: hypothetical protein EP348_03440 [Alphaproteobacteria bacterium]
MDLPSSLSIEMLKQQAKSLRNELNEKGTLIGHSEALERLAHRYRFKNWNTLQAVVKERASTLSLMRDDKVKGRYLGQPFTGTVFKIEPQGASRYRLTLNLDTPVDVVRFASFSAHRKRITATVGPDGKTAERTSDGMPQLILDL